eukprot:262393-Pelagomonas_calceolata.AAC.3
MTSTTALRKSAPLVLLMIITLLISIFVSTSQAVRCAVSQDRHIDLPENTHDVGSDDHSHEDGELLIWAKQPFEPDQDYGHCITAHVHIDENHDDHEHAGFHVESVFDESGLNLYGAVGVPVSCLLNVCYTISISMNCGACCCQKERKTT